MAKYLRFEPTLPNTINHEDFYAAILHCYDPVTADHKTQNWKIIFNVGYSVPRDQIQLWEEKFNHYCQVAHAIKGAK